MTSSTPGGPVHIFRSERYAAGMLLGAAALALVLANLPLGPALLGLRDAPLPLPGTGLDLTVGHWISDGILAIFFFLIAVELRHELTHGELASPARALVPAVAALGGVVVPAGVYLLCTAGSGFQEGWPVPTATDIAFALGVLAIFGRGLPPRVRAFLLALAVLDDLVAILIIALFFAQDPELLLLGGAAVAVAAFALLSRLLGTRGRILVGVALVAVALIAWYFVYRSGVHPTIAGVALGLVMSPKPARRSYSAIEPFSNTVVLPLFAFSAALVVIPQVSPLELSAPFWGILLGLPLGKLVGITVAGGIALRLGHRGGTRVLEGREILLVAALGGIGFTVSLLMNELAFARSAEVADEGTLAVLLGSAVSIVVSAALVSAASLRARRRTAPAAAPRPT
ncbi:Na+/H+ antiporter NhaA [Naasia sp.]|jgi:NhaA family Na+:H+ antiporter|uniref:Na+/H+ antiporter NhaA n=1 Tax=Naasia sp. TaxID=2546198 RepID=UPI002626C405|nr:Na+/H+ antiporter NhaA [Naasia sp.]